MRTTPHIPRYQIGQAGSAADVEGLPAMMLAQQPDSIIDAGIVGGLTIRGASVRGSGHRYDGTPRQDDFCYGGAGGAGEWFVAVVADGVSSGPRSHIAARVAVRIGVQAVSQALDTGPPAAIDWDQLVGTIAGHVLLQARKEAGDESIDASAASKIMATTAAFVIVPVNPDPNGARECTVLPIGDTSVWVLRSGTQWESVTLVKNAGEAIASSAVFALPLLPATSIVPITTVLLRGDALFVVTDGIGDPLGSGGGEVGDALSRIWSTPPNRFEFGAQVDFNRRSHTDDRTVVGVWPDQVSPEPAPTLIAIGAEQPAWVNLAPAEIPPSPAFVVDAPPFDFTSSGPAAAPPPAPGAPSPPATSADSATWEPTPWEPTPWGNQSTSGETVGEDQS